ncbi:hypothetical protein EBN88_05425 [Streptomyces triticirhizae]|uniref:Uncharacterized protein n=2 Tax=Streptomyces triticirhizae TaxID=2483353 RepID=A0A3M2M4P6_9ACTN|nr:hypothetical protein EBN88_05425 [Streptomyces triticirhizae]
MPPGRETGGPLVEQPTPCGCTIHYPAVLGELAVTVGACHALPAMCDHGNGHIITTEADGVHFRISGGPGAVAQVYEAIPWPQQVLQFPGGYPDGHACKRAPSAEALRDYFANL